MFVNDYGDLLHFYFGRKIDDSDYSIRTNEWNEKWGYATNEFQLDVHPQEYPTYGHSDLRHPAFRAVNKHLNTVSQFKVRDIKIHKESAANISGMPSLFKGKGNADTLEAVLYDKYTDIEAHLFYTVFDEYNIVARNTVIVNKSASSIELTDVYSSSVDLPLGEYDMIYFPGHWLREREMRRIHIENGIVIEADNMRESSHQQNPFAIIAERGANEDYGEVYGFSLIYSGNHSTVAASDQFGNVRVMQGINPNEFSAILKPNEQFATPQSVICYSYEGIGALSNEYHDVYRNNLMRSKWANKKRPILINNWEATYFDFDEDRLIEIISKAKDAGIELFVLDDGWFGERNTDDRSLGDWVVNKEKLPSGLKGLSDKIDKIGMKFGIWIEPEMVNKNSDLYRAHPDWTVRTQEREPIEGRNQLILDLSRSEVCDYIIQAIKTVLNSADIKYVKWDFNRPMTDMPRKGYNHEYTLGLYRIMSELTSSFPDVLFEGCCGGGGRFDPGILAYMPQIWTSDNSDAAARMKIQYSTSICYPVCTMSNHVTAVPNHQCGRITSLKTRGDTAYAGIFGYELDITKSTEEEIKEIIGQIDFYKRIQPLVISGDFYRLKNPYNSNYCAWQLISKDKSHIFAYTSRILSEANVKVPLLRLKGLKASAKYVDVATDTVYSGDMLMYRGIRIEYPEIDFATAVIEFKEV